MNSASQDRSASLRRRVIGPVAMAFVALLAVSAAVPAYAVIPEAASSTGYDQATGVGAQSLQVSAAATITIQRDGYTSAAAPKPKPKPKPVAKVRAAGVAGSGTGWFLPLAGRVSSAFGARPNAPVDGVSAFHKGADIAAPCGQPVRAATAGTVIEAGYQGSYGNWVLIDHGNGIQTGYAHNSQILVGIGQPVAAGATIARVGSTGASSGCHVHFETRVGGSQVDPVPFMGSRGVRLG